MLKVFIVEDEELLSFLLCYNLEVERYGVEVCVWGDEVEICLCESQLDLFLLDWMLFGLFGIEFCCRFCVCEDIECFLVIMLIVCGEEVECICGLLIGVDDYVVKLFLVFELMVWVWVILCWVSLEVVFMMLWLGDIELDCEIYCVCWSIKEIYLGLIEFCFLEFLMIVFGCVFLCEQFLDGVWGYDVYVDE